MSVELASLIRELLTSRSFEEASAVVLRPMLRHLQQAIASHAPLERARALRGMVHLRPNGGYRGLTVLEAETGTLVAAPDLEGFLPSASGWRWVQAYQCAVSIDVNLARVHPLGESSSAAHIDTHLAGAALDSLESQQRLRTRSATHVFLFPLRMPGAGIDGTLSIEVNCPAAVGTPLLWRECADALQLMADVAAPYLASLPFKPDLSSITDELLPVVGRTMQPIIRTLRTFAQQDETILLLGPTGVGKSRLARWCHQQSRRSAQRFEVVDLQSIPEDVQMGELFGWKKGAFTGALNDNVGFVGRAEGGTLFLDELDKLSLRAQAGLLHLLEERQYRVLGDSGRERRANVRFIIGSNVDLFEAVKQGRISEDLYYRINVLPLKVPALRERMDELPAWAQYMLSRRSRELHGSGEATLTAEAVLELLSHSWPGNLRQLDNVIRRACSLALLEYESSGRTLVVRERHVEGALASERNGAPGSLTGSLRVAASAFVEELDRRAARGDMWDLDWIEALRGFVLLTALKRHGDLDEIFRRLGKESLVRNRNHHRAVRREFQRILELYQALGQPLEPDLLALRHPGRDDDDPSPPDPSHRF